MVYWHERGCKQTSTSNRKHCPPCGASNCFIHPSGCFAVFLFHVPICLWIYLCAPGFLCVIHSFCLSTRIPVCHFIRMYVHLSVCVCVCFFVSLCVEYLHVFCLKHTCASDMSYPPQGRVTGRIFFWNTWAWSPPHLPRAPLQEVLGCLPWTPLPGSKKRHAWKMGLAETWGWNPLGWYKIS